MLTTRYFIKNLLSATAFIALTLTMVIWLTQSLRILELVANSDAPASLFVKLVALSLPRFLEIILPLSTVAATLFIYHKFITDNELIVMRACGFGQYALARPAMIVAGGATAIVLVLTTWASPRCYTEMHQLRQVIKAQYSSFLLREGVFNTFGSDLTVYLRRRLPNGDLLGLVIHDTRDKDKPPVTITAKRGRIMMDGDIPNIIVTDGMRQQLDAQSHAVSKLFFQHYTIEIKGLDSSPRLRWREPSERTFIELLNPDPANPQDMASRDEFMAEAHHRIVTPFNALTYAMVALCCLLLGPFNRRGQAKKVLTASLLVIALQAANMAAASAARESLYIVPALYALTFLPLFTCLWLLHARGESWLSALLRRVRRLREAAA